MVVVEGVYYLRDLVSFDLPYPHEQVENKCSRQFEKIATKIDEFKTNSLMEEANKKWRNRIIEAYEPVRVRTSSLYKSLGSSY